MYFVETSFIYTQQVQRAHLSLALDTRPHRAGRGSTGAYSFLLYQAYSSLYILVLSLSSVSTMEDPYKHPVFFECPSLDEEQRKRIENYFHIRRKSGGGDCGSITNIHDKVYSIAFKEREGKIGCVIFKRLGYLFNWSRPLSCCAGESESMHALETC